MQFITYRSGKNNLNSQQLHASTSAQLRRSWSSWSRGQGEDYPPAGILGKEAWSRCSATRTRAASIGRPREVCPRQRRLSKGSIATMRWKQEESTCYPFFYSFVELLWPLMRFPCKLTLQINESTVRVNGGNLNCRWSLNVKWNKGAHIHDLCIRVPFLFNNNNLIA